MPSRTRRAVVTASRPVEQEFGQEPGDEPVVEEGLPYGMQPVEAPDPVASQPIDLEPYESKWRGFKIVVDMDLELRAQEAILQIQDRYTSTGDRLEATYQFLETVLLAWNFSERYVDNHGRLRSRQLEQPRDGGVRRLKGSQLKPLMEAVNSAYVASPNS